MKNEFVMRHQSIDNEKKKKDFQLIDKGKDNQSIIQSKTGKAGER